MPAEPAPRDTGRASTEPATTPRRAPGPGAPRRPLARWGFGIFAVGLLAVAVIMVLFATGSHDLPLWLNLAAMLAPIGFGIGLLGVFLEARRPPRGTRLDSCRSSPTPGLSPTGRS